MVCVSGLCVSVCVCVVCVGVHTISLLLTFRWIPPSRPSKSKTRGLCPMGSGHQLFVFWCWSYSVSSLSNIYCVLQKASVSPGLKLLLSQEQSTLSIIIYYLRTYYTYTIKTGLMYTVSSA